ncbi:MAG TPA: SIS domain-containing protein, partial [Tepidisphaeraceae bacterium]|nr:SIS domain-containing protein [Tepidisphaeraceae bacterium]
MAETILQFARSVLDAESAAVQSAAAALDEHFEKAVKLILGCKGAVLVCGVGKAGHIARKISATLASTGTPSHFLSASDAVHGDLGSIRQGDLVLIFSSSGETDEILRMLSIIKKLSHGVIAVTASRTSSLGKFA